MKSTPPWLHDGALDVQVGEAGSSHCVCQTRSLSVSGNVGAASDRFASFIVTRRHAVPAGWHEEAAGQVSEDETRSRFGMLAPLSPSASYVASSLGSVAEPSRMASPLGCCLAYTPDPPIWRTYIACEP